MSTEAPWHNASGRTASGHRHVRKGCLACDPFHRYQATTGSGYTVTDRHANNHKPQPQPQPQPQGMEKK